MKDEKKDLTKAVVYTDGSAIPNPGHAGWGFHCYLYGEFAQKRSANKPKNFVNTTVGYTERSYATRNDLQEVVTDDFIDAFGAIDGESTNNVGEVTAFFKAYFHLIGLGVTNINVLSDSMYLINMYKRVLKDGDVSNQFPTNTELWVDMARILIHTKEKGIKLSITFIKGHSGDPGNERADKMATLGRTAKEDVYRTSVDQRYWTQTKDIHPFLSNTQLFYAEDGIEDLDVYATMSYKDSEDVGRNMTSITYGIVKPPEMDETIRDAQRLFRDISTEEDIVNTYNVISLPALSNVTTTRDIRLFGKDAFVFERRRKGLLSNTDEDVIIKNVRPAGLAMLGLSNCLNLKGIQDDIIRMISETDPLKETTIDDMTFINITDMIYEYDITRKLKVKLALKKNNKNLIVPTEECNVPVKFGISFLKVNALSKIANRDPQVTLVIRRTNLKIGMFYIHIKLDDGTVGTWCNFFSNKILYRV